MTLENLENLKKIGGLNEEPPDKKEFEGLVASAKDRLNDVLYGSVAKQSDTAASDIDLLLVSDELTLEAVYAALTPVEKLFDRRVNPTLYTSKEFSHRRKTKNAFLTRVLKRPKVVLMGAVDDA